MSMMRAVLVGGLAALLGATSASAFSSSRLGALLTGGQSLRRTGAGGSSSASPGAATPAPALSSAAGERDRVVALPGQPAGPQPGALYAGYVTVDDGAGRALFYVLEAAREPITSPLVLWLNGGPGCSSLGGGWLSETGQYWPTEDGSLEANPYAWRSLASVVYLESPAFVGYSYSNTSSDAVVGDARAAADARSFLLGFLDRFPGLRGADLYIAGESYAGHYIPQLAEAILAGNAGPQAGGARTINLRGVAIGNPWTDPASDNAGAAVHWYSHYHISRKTYEAMVTSCNFTSFGPIASAGARLLLRGAWGDGGDDDDDDDACETACDRATGEMGDTNLYDLFADSCASDANASAAGAPRGDAATLARALALRGRPAAAAAAAQASRRAVKGLPNWDGSGFPPVDPCEDGAVAAYLNRADVRAALHVRPDAPRWAMCTDALDYSYEDVLTSQLPVWRRLLGAPQQPQPSSTSPPPPPPPPLRVLIYSGDTDGVVPTSGSREWVEGLGLAEAAPWRPWVAATGDHAPGAQVSGYVVAYDRGLTFATVRGAGHMVPQTQPGRALHLLRAFLEGAQL